MHQLIYSIKNPVGKDITITAIPIDSKARLAVYPPSERAPDLYEQKPYVIYGRSQDLQDFYLFIQGKYYDKWLDIKHLVSFTKAKKITRKEIEKALALQEAYTAYDNYLKDGRMSHLMKAERILKPFKIPLAFQ